jgi:hypothetical protein
MRRYRPHLDPASHREAALDRRAANLRRESIHTLTTRLTRRYGTLVVEDLDVAAMGKGMGRRAFRRSKYQAGLGQFGASLVSKTSWAGGKLLVADRRFASSKTHHGCGGYHADLRLGQWVWVCPERLDRTGQRPGCPAGRSCRPGADRGRPRRAGSRSRRGRARPCKTTARWRRPTTPEPTSHPWGQGTPSRGARLNERSTTAHSLGNGGRLVPSVCHRSRCEGVDQCQGRSGSGSSS